MVERLSKMGFLVVWDGCHGSEAMSELKVGYCFEWTE